MALYKGNISYISRSSRFRSTMSICRRSPWAELRSEGRGRVLRLIVGRVRAQVMAAQKEKELVK